jgi:hypothetical protein
MIVITGATSTPAHAAATASTPTLNPMFFVFQDRFLGTSSSSGYVGCHVVAFGGTVAEEAAKHELATRGVAAPFQPSRPSASFIADGFDLDRMHIGFRGDTVRGSCSAAEYTLSLLSFSPRYPGRNRGEDELGGLEGTRGLGEKWCYSTDPCPR